MYLSRLNQEEKEYFLELAHYMANSDKDFSRIEQDVIKNYCQEMGVEKYKKKSIDIDNIIRYFSRNTTKNIVMLEILALAFMDGNYNLEEKKTISKIQQAFGFSDEKLRNFVQWVKNVINIYKEGEQLVNA